MATNVTLITGEGATSYTVSTGSRGPTGATGAAGPNTITTSTTTPLVGFLSGNGTTVTASTSATFVNGSTANFDSGSSAFFASGSGATFDTGTGITFFSGSTIDFFPASVVNFPSGTIKLAGTSFDSSLNFVDPTSSKTITLPDATGTVALTNDPRFTDARTPLAHTHGNISNVGAIGSTATLPLITTTAGVITTGTFGTTAGTFTQGNDARLSDARTPLAHTHVVSDIVSIASQRLIGRHAGGAGAGQEIQASGGVEFSGGAIQRSALTGDITASAGSNATTLADGSVTTQKIATGVTLTGPTLTGTPVFSATSYNYGVGAAFAHRSSLGLKSAVAISDESKTPNDTNFHDDAELFLTLEAGTWLVKTNAFWVNSDNTIGVRFQLEFSGTTDTTKSAIIVFSGSSSNSAEILLNSSPSRPVGVITATMPRTILIAATGRNAMMHAEHTVSVSVAGVYSLKWGQGTASSTIAAVRKAGSFIFATRIV